MLDLFTKLFSRSIGLIGYFADHLPLRALNNKIVVTPSYEVDICDSERECLIKTEQIYGVHYRYSLKYFQKETFISCHKDVIFLGNSGAIVEERNAVVAESAFDELRLIKSPSFRMPSLMFGKNKKGVYTSVIHLPWSKWNIYHWFIDCLPRFYSIKQIPFESTIFLIVNDRLEPFQEESVKFFLQEDSRLKLVKIKNSEKWYIDEFWLPSFASSHMSGYLPKEHICYVKSIILQGYQINNSSSKKKIYISRKGALKRRILNEASIINLLERSGYLIVQAEKLAFRDQVELFVNASVIISCHGAGLTHVLFASDCKVVEIQPENMVKSHYCLLSKACGHEYRSYISGTADNNLDFCIDLDGFVDLIGDLIN
ncbi:glycosyltransferase family 61 protein [Rufibacter aurantiacus]|uniref:glycosyltransferase family 61 protein n=1 Tax=Rufibacter aurantiacus TaxID=2817374 RepID=UPI001B317E0C|nr:glycosyltransferase 61 family protein [Rufibacter aurantiacus]